MDDDAQLALRLAMYADADADADAETAALPTTPVAAVPRSDGVRIPLPLRGVKITSQDGTRTLPSMAYVAAVERLVAEHATRLRSMATLDRLERLERSVQACHAKLARLERMLRHTSVAQSQQGRHVREMARDLDNKVNRRDAL